MADIRTQILDAVASAIALEWGTPKQIEAENRVYEITEREFGIDWEQHDYLLRATTGEAMAYVLKTIKF